MTYINAYEFCWLLSLGVATVKRGPNHSFDNKRRVSFLMQSSYLPGLGESTTT